MLHIFRLPLLALLSIALLASSPAAQSAPQRLALEPVLHGVSYVVGVTHTRGDPHRLFVVQQHGLVLLMVDGVLQGSPYLDIQSRMMPLGAGGILALAFHPDYANNGLFFVSRTDLAGDVVLTRFSRAGNDPDHADPNSETILLDLPQPAPSHNGCGLAFGPDGYLYAGFGDGGVQGDPQGLAKDLGGFYGKILRLDVDHPAGGLAYGIPPSNPFVGVPGARAEIWALGLRNPWRITIDQLTGDLWLGDVGWQTSEEINHQPGTSAGGEHYGWNVMEGSDCRTPPTGCNSAGLTLPLYEYLHVYWGPILRCAVIGGVVYRGRDMATLEGRYLFTDHCSDEITSLSQQGGVLTSEFMHLRIPAVGGVACTSANFGEDEAGEVYLGCRASRTVYRLIPGGLRLQSPELAAGSVSALRISGGTPSSPAALAASARGLGDWPIPPWSVSLSLDAPRLLGLIHTDGTGAANVPVALPWVLSGRNLWLQVAQRGIASNVVRRAIL